MHPETQPGNNGNRTAIFVEVNNLRFQLVGGMEIFGRQSAVRNYLSCHRLYGWDRVENLTPEMPRWPLEFGSAAHLFLQEYGRGVPTAEALKMAERRMLQNFPKAITPDEEIEREEMRENLRNLLPAYVAYWGEDEEREIPIGQEVKGVVEVGEGTGVKLVFQLDKLVSYLGSIWIRDYKTMRKNDDRDFQKFEVDIQPTAYVYGASKVLKTRVAGIIIDGLIKTKVPQFRRESFMRTDEELQEFENEFPEIMHEIAWRHARVNNGENWKTVFYKNTQHCLHWGRKCDFWSLCHDKDSPIARMAYNQRTPDYMDAPKILLEKGGAE
jgi:hypothetical protein